MDRSVKMISVVCFKGTISNSHNQEMEHKTQLSVLHLGFRVKKKNNQDLSCWLVKLEVPAKKRRLCFPKCPDYSFKQRKISVVVLVNQSKLRNGGQKAEAGDNLRKRCEKELVNVSLMILFF